MQEFLELVYKMWEHATFENIWFLLIISSCGIGAYFIIKLINENIKGLSEYLRSQFKSRQIKHAKAIKYRKKITCEVRKYLESLILKLDSDTGILFEFSNGNSNIAGLPFLFLNATQEINSFNCNHISDKLQKLNVSLLSEFLIKLEEEKLLVIDDINNIKDIYPILYGILMKSDLKSASFSILEGKDGPVGMLFVGSKKFNMKNGFCMTKEMISNSNKISNLLDYNNVGKYENR